MQVREVATAPIAGQKTGTSGLRKKVREFQQPHYLENWIQALFLALGDSAQGAELVLGGDGRYHNSTAVQTIIRMAAANGVARVVVGRGGILATPAISALIRERKSTGGVILTASHNPGGPEEDFGIKFNAAAGEPASEAVTSCIFIHTETLTSYRIADLPHVDVDTLGEQRMAESFVVEVVDSVEVYERTLQGIFDFPAIAKLIARKDFNILLDSLHGVTGPYVKRIFGGLGADEASFAHADLLEDFGGLHPDPNLTYAAELVARMWEGKHQFGAAFDGDGDRNMVLGSSFFVSPSDSVAVIAEYAKQCIPYFSTGLSAVARSMPTSGALDRVAEAQGITLYEVPTGWKFFGNIMDHYEKAQAPGVVCGEESFGTGSDHIREKDGIWAVLAWLSILAHVNKDTAEGALVGVADVVRGHWAKYGRNYYSRHDFEQVSSDAANQLMAGLRAQLDSLPGTSLGPFKVKTADDFEYHDQFDGSVSKQQGVRLVFACGSRMIFRLSGTGSSGATIRLYLEQYRGPGAVLDEDTQTALGDLIAEALNLSKMQELTGRSSPTVIT